MVQNQLAKCGRKLSLGVSICLDVVSIKTLELDIFKSQPQLLRLSRQSKKVGLNCWNFLGNFKSQVLIVSIPLSLNFQHSLHWEPWSQQFQKVGIDSREILDSFKSQVLIILIPESLNFQHSLHWEFQSRQFQTVGLNSWEILDNFKKLSLMFRLLEGFVFVENYLT
jgi:hypothetical protein